MDDYISVKQPKLLIQVEITNGSILKEILSLLNAQKDGDVK